MGGTNRYAVAIAVGPVGRFISAGRRSRDLWYGSRLLSEMTRRVALSLRNRCEVAFWTPREATLLGTRAGDTSTERRENEPPFFDARGLRRHEGPVISNKIRAVVALAEGEDIVEVLHEAERDARAWLVGEFKVLREEARNDPQIGIHIASLEKQVEAIPEGDFMEFYAAYARAEGEGQGDQQKALARAQDLRNARKNSRVFVAPSWTQPGHLRSTIEPGRDSVLVHYDPRDQAEEAVRARVYRHTKGIRSDERLDAVALLRRYAAMKEATKERKAETGTGASPQRRRRLLPGLPFPPLSRVAADPWIDGIDQWESRAWHPRHRPLREVRDVLMHLEEQNREALHLISSPSREPGTYREDMGKTWSEIREEGTFPYDASLLMEGGIDAARRELKRLGKVRTQAARPGSATGVEKQLTEARKALQQIDRHVKALHRRHGPPPRYYVLMTADGDGIGQALSQQTTFEAEQALVKALDAFAQSAWQTLCGTGRGVPFYVGGDELVAYLPLDTAFDTARELAEHFSKVSEEARLSGARLGDTLSLSLGLVVAHVSHDLRDVRTRAEQALHDAKQARKDDKSDESWICVVESVAGAADRVTVSRTNAYVERMRAWNRLLDRDRISMSTAHGILEVLAPLEQPGGGASGSLGWTDDADALRAGLVVAAGSIVQRHRRREGNRGQESETLPDAVRACLPGAGELLSSNAEALKRCADRLRQVAYEIILANRIRGVETMRAGGTGKPAHREEESR